MDDLSFRFGNYDAIWHEYWLRLGDKISPARAAAK